jgi:hypothetical protein
VEAQEFQRALIIVLGAGSLIAGTGTLLLFLAFRRLDETKARRASPFALMGGVIAFVFGCCLLLFMLAYR